MFKVYCRYTTCGTQVVVYDEQHIQQLVLTPPGEDGWMDTQGHLIGLSNPAHQDQLMVVPLPMPALLAGIGFAGAIVLRRRLR